MTATFASYAAVAIENARLYDLAQERAYASAALLQVAQAVASLNKLDEILANIIRTMPILVGTERAALYLWDANSQMFSPGKEFGLSGQDRSQIWSCRFASGEFPMLDAARDRNQMVVRVLRANDTPTRWTKLQPPKNSEDAFRDGPRLLISLPISIKAEFFGVLLLEEAENSRRFRDRRMEIISGIVQQLALAIQSDRLQGEMVARERLETEVTLAQQIQRAFIPQTLPQYEGWQLAGRWETAREVGGDFYDVIDLPDQRVGLFIGDVADKGMPAALFMALTRTLVRAAVNESSSPAVVLQRVNDLLIPDASLGMFVTGVYGVLDLKTNEFTYANAGHNPPLWIRADGQIQTLTRTGIALGLIESSVITARTIRLGHGEGILLYTDGITEAFSPSGDMFGESRLLDTIRAVDDASAVAMLDDIESRVKGFMESLPLSDDMTLLVVKRT